MIKNIQDRLQNVTIVSQNESTPNDLNPKNFVAAKILEYLETHPFDQLLPIMQKVDALNGRLMQSQGVCLQIAAQELIREGKVREAVRCILQITSPDVQQDVLGSIALQFYREGYTGNAAKVILLIPENNRNQYIDALRSSLQRHEIFCRRIDQFNQWVDEEKLSSPE
jgi:hypothetical protein